MYSVILVAMMGNLPQSTLEVVNVPITADVQANGCQGQRFALVPMTLAPVHGCSGGAPQSGGCSGNSAGNGCSGGSYGDTRLFAGHRNRVAARRAHRHGGASSSTYEESTQAFAIVPQGPAPQAFLPATGTTQLAMAQQPTYWYGNQCFGPNCPR